MTSHLNDYLETLNAICRSLANNHNRQAEKKLIALLEQILANEKQHPCTISFISRLLCENFNQYYCAWMEQHGNKHNIPVRTSYLLSICTDPVTMQELIWDIRHYFHSMSEAYVKREIHPILIEYKKNL